MIDIEIWQHLVSGQHFAIEYDSLGTIIDVLGPLTDEEIAGIKDGHFWIGAESLVEGEQFLRSKNDYRVVWHSVFPGKA